MKDRFHWLQGLPIILFVYQQKRHNYLNNYNAIDLCTTTHTNTPPPTNLHSCIVYWSVTQSTYFKDTIRTLGSPVVQHGIRSVSFHVFSGLKPTDQGHVLITTHDDWRHLDGHLECLTLTETKVVDLHDGIQSVVCEGDNLLCQNVPICRFKTRKYPYPFVKKSYCAKELVSISF